MSGILRAYLAIFLPVLLSGMILGWVACALRAHWRDKPVPYLPTDKAIDGAIATVTCPWCRPEPHGRCTCGVACRHERCVRLSLADLDYLDGRSEMPR